MYKVRIQLYIKDDHGEDILTSINQTLDNFDSAMLFVEVYGQQHDIQAVRMVKING